MHRQACPGGNLDCQDLLPIVASVDELGGEFAETDRLRSGDASAIRQLKWRLQGEAAFETMNVFDISRKQHAARTNALVATLARGQQMWRHRGNRWQTLVTD